MFSRASDSKKEKMETPLVSNGSELSLGIPTCTLALLGGREEPGKRLIGRGARPTTSAFNRGVPRDRSWRGNNRGRLHVKLDRRVSQTRRREQRGSHVTPESLAAPGGSHSFAPSCSQEQFMSSLKRKHRQGLRWQIGSYSDFFGASGRF